MHGPRPVDELLTQHPRQQSRAPERQRIEKCERRLLRHRRPGRADRSTAGDRQHGQRHPDQRHGRLGRGVGVGPAFHEAACSCRGSPSARSGTAAGRAPEAPAPPPEPRRRPAPAPPARPRRRPAPRPPRRRGAPAGWRARESPSPGRPPDDREIDRLRHRRDQSHHQHPHPVGQGIARDIRRRGEGGKHQEIELARARGGQDRPELPEVLRQDPGRSAQAGARPSAPRPDQGEGPGHRRRLRQPPTPPAGGSGLPARAPPDHRPEPGQPARRRQEREGREAPEAVDEPARRHRQRHAMAERQRRIERTGAATAIAAARKTERRRHDQPRLQHRASRRGAPRGAPRPARARPGSARSR